MNSLLNITFRLFSGVAASQLTSVNLIPLENMIGYFTIAALVFSSVSHDFIKDKEARKDDLGAWFFITFAALIWPLTLPTMVRTVVATWLNSHRSQENQSLPAA